MNKAFACDWSMQDRVIGLGGETVCICKIATFTRTL